MCAKTPPGQKHIQKLIADLKINTINHVGTPLQNKSAGADVFDNTSGGIYFSGAKPY